MVEPVREKPSTPNLPVSWDKSGFFIGPLRVFLDWIGEGFFLSVLLFTAIGTFLLIFTFGLMPIWGFFLLVPFSSASDSVTLLLSILGNSTGTFFANSDCKRILPVFIILPTLNLGDGFLGGGFTFDLGFGLGVIFFNLDQSILLVWPLLVFLTEVPGFVTDEPEPPFFICPERPPPFVVGPLPGFFTEG